MFVSSTTRKPSLADSIAKADPIPDPLDQDDPADEVVMVTRRHLGRIALVSSEVTARFQREGLELDPMAWMFAPLALFGGRNAIEAVLELQGCRRAVLLHGLGIGLDADPCTVDEMCSAEGGGSSVVTRPRSRHLS